VLFAGQCRQAAGCRLDHGDFTAKETSMSLVHAHHVAQVAKHTAEALLLPAAPVFCAVCGGRRAFDSNAQRDQRA
jgi:hypothetical protein